MPGIEAWRLWFFRIRLLEFGHFWFVNANRLSIIFHVDLDLSDDTLNLLKVVFCEVTQVITQHT